MAKTVFITGGATGTGAAAVRAFAAAGWRVTFMDSRPQEAKALINSIDSEEAIFFFEGSPRNRAALDAALELASDEAGGINALITCSGFYRPNTIIDILPGELDDMIQCNITGTVNSLQAALPFLANAGDDDASVIITIPTVSSAEEKGGSCSAGICRGALLQLTGAAAGDLENLGIRVNAAIIPARSNPGSAEKLLSLIGNHGLNGAIVDLSETDDGNIVNLSF